MMVFEAIPLKSKGIEHHFVFRTTVPARVEVTIQADGILVAYAYQGPDDDQEQDPVVMHTTEAKR